MEMFCEYLPDLIQEIPAGASGQKCMWRLAIDCKMLTAQMKQQQFGISFPIYTRLSHISNHAKPERIVSPYPYMQLHHMPLSTQNMVISIKISVLLSALPKCMFFPRPVSHQATQAINH